MFSYIKEFITRHRKKIIIVGVVFGGAIFGSKYAQQKFIEWQENETKEFLERTRKQHHFENTEKTCNQTILFLSSTLRDNIIGQVNCEQIIQRLREGSSNKVELWQELKILVFTKVSLLVYSGTLLVIALRIHLNVIGGHIYCKSVMSGSDSKITNDLQEKYLSQCHYFLKEGVRELYPMVLEKVHSALKDITLSQNLSLRHLENIFWAIQASINSDERNPIKNMPRLLYGADSREDNKFIKEMMLDTIDLLQSQEVADLASSCVSRGFSHVIDRISEFFLPEENSNPSNNFLNINNSVEANIKFTHPNNLAKPFAKIIPIINGFGNQTTTLDLSEAWISPFIYMENIKMLGANIYESYSCADNS